MKKIFLTALLSAASVGAFGQGTLDLANIIKGTFVAPIFQPNPADPMIEQTGQPASSVYSGALPTGTTVYGGAPVTTAYDMVFLYSLNGGATSTSQMSVGTVTPFRSATSATASPAGGIVTIGGYAVPGTTGGTLIAFQFAAFYVDPTIAAWEAVNPGYTPAALYNEAVTDFFSSDLAAQMGYGAVVDSVVLAGTDTAGVIHPPQTTGDGLWTSFEVEGAPEPSTFVLAGLGAAGLLLFRRRK